MRTTTVNGSNNAPFRGSKRTTLEGGIRVPFFMQWKGKLPAGKVYSELVIQLDILPTALAAAGVALPTDSALDGVDLLPHLTGKADNPPHEALYWRFGQQMAIRRGDLKLVRYDTTADESPPDSDQPARKGKKGPKASAAPVSPVRLYNLAADVGERVDLASLMPDRVKELQFAWNKWNEKNISPLWGGGARAGTGAAKRATK
jgi:arylsulfatase A-like enzyme